MNYELFLSKLDERLCKYFELHSKYIHCGLGCSLCCEKGDYPLSSIELEYLMRGFLSLNNEIKRKVQLNIKNMVKGEACPFLIDKTCSVYPYRPIICRVHGLAYLCKENMVKVPYCVNEDKNYKSVYQNGEIFIQPIAENLDTSALLKDYVIKDLADWLTNTENT